MPRHQVQLVTPVSICSLGLEMVRRLTRAAGSLLFRRQHCYRTLRPLLIAELWFTSAWSHWQLFDQAADLLVLKFLDWVYRSHGSSSTYYGRHAGLRVIGAIGDLVQQVALSSDAPFFANEMVAAFDSWSLDPPSFSQLSEYGRRYSSLQQLRPSAEK